MMASEDVIHPSSDSFWEVDCYKRTVKRQDDGHKMCTDLMQLINDRGHIEKEYAKALKAWSKKWSDLIDKGRMVNLNFFAINMFIFEAAMTLVEVAVRNSV